MTIPFLQARSIKLKVSPKFPSMLYGRNGITVNKANGNYFIDLDYSKYAPISTIPPGDVPNLYILLWNAATGIYELAPVTLVGALYTQGNITVANASPWTVQQNDSAVIVNKPVGSPSIVNLPLAGFKTGPVHISDGKGDAGTNNITINPTSPETISGLASWTIAANRAGITLYPVPGTGWFT